MAFKKLTANIYYVRNNAELKAAAIDHDNITVCAFAVNDSWLTVPAFPYAVVLQRTPNVIGRIRVTAFITGQDATNILAAFTEG